MTVPAIVSTPTYRYYSRRSDCADRGGRVLRIPGAGYRRRLCAVASVGALHALSSVTLCHGASSRTDIAPPLLRGHGDIVGADSGRSNGPYSRTRIGSNSDAPSLVTDARENNMKNEPSRVAPSMLRAHLVSSDRTGKHVSLSRSLEQQADNIDDSINGGYTYLEVSLALTASLLSILSILIATLLFLTASIIKYRRLPAMQLAQPSILAMFTMSGATTVAGCYLIIPWNDMSCTFRDPIILTSLSLSGSVLAGRVWRISTIMSPVLSLGVSSFGGARSEDDSTTVSGGEDKASSASGISRDRGRRGALEPLNGGGFIGIC